MKIIVFRTTSMLAAAIILSACGNSMPPSAQIQPTQSATVSTTNVTASLKPDSTLAAPAVQVTVSARPDSTVAASTAAMTPTQIIEPAAPKVTTAAEAGVEGAGGEAALVTYADAAQGYSVARPATWTQDMSVKDGIKFDGGDGSMTLAFITTAAKDVLAFASSDAKMFAAGSPSFGRVGLAPSTEVAHAVVLGFTTTGTSQVTGKTYKARGDRYYIGLKDGRIAILTFVSSTRNYDREGVRDIALTLKVTK